MVCDFCGAEEETVRRIVMDSDYNRLYAPALYACLKCSIEKEEERIQNCERDI
jgi:uncharacterized Zn finger protein